MTIQYADLPDRGLNPNEGVFHPSTAAAREFQNACRRDNWADFARTSEVLRRMAKSRFPRRGDVYDVLDQTIFEYGLWRGVNPRGFWTAFTRDMIDSRKAAYNVTKDQSYGDSSQWEQAPEHNRTDYEMNQRWMRDRATELHAAELAFLPT